MKPLLRALLLVDAVLVLAAGLLFLASPWLGLISAQLTPVAPSPALTGQLYGLALLGLAWLLGHAAVNGALTAPVAKIGAIVIGLSGLVLLVWVLVVGQPTLDAFPKFLMIAAGGIALILGLVQTRLALAVGRRERLAALGAASAARAEAKARREPLGVATENYGAPPAYVPPDVPPDVSRPGPATATVAQPQSPGYSPLHRPLHNPFRRSADKPAGTRLEPEPLHATTSVPAARGASDVDGLDHPTMPPTQSTPSSVVSPVPVSTTRTLPDRDPATSVDPRSDAPSGRIPPKL